MSVPGEQQEGMASSGLARGTALYEVHDHCHCCYGGGNTTAPCFTAAPLIGTANPCDMSLKNHSGLGEKIWIKIMNIISVSKMWKKIRKNIQVG